MSEEKKITRRNFLRAAGLVGGSGRSSRLRSASPGPRANRGTGRSSAHGCTGRSADRSPRRRQAVRRQDAEDARRQRRQL